MCMIDGCEPNDFSTYTMRKARKEHRCAECHRVIGPGETYRRNVSAYDGMMDTHKVCSHCQVAATWLSENCGGYVTHAVEEDIAQHVDEYAYLGWRFLAGLGRIKIGMRRGWVIKYGPHKGRLMPLPKLPPAIDEKTPQPAPQISTTPAWFGDPHA